MPPKRNPLSLNPLQLKTLTLMQYLAGLTGAESATADEIEIVGFPHPHGDHFHLGHVVVATRDASGLANQSVWLALERKGLIKADFPDRAVVTRAGLDYETGLADQILHSSDH